MHVLRTHANVDLGQTLNLNEKSASKSPGLVPWLWGQSSERGRPEHHALWQAVGWGERRPGVHRCLGLSRGGSCQQPAGAVTRLCSASWQHDRAHAPSRLGRLLRAGGAGVGEAAGALACSGMGMWGGSSPAPLSSQQWLSQPPPPTRAM